MNILSKTAKWPSEKLLPPDNGDHSVKLALGPEGGIGRSDSYDSPYLVTVQSHTGHFAFVVYFDTNPFELSGTIILSSQRRLRRLKFLACGHMMQALPRSEQGRGPHS